MTFILLWNVKEWFKKKKKSFVFCLVFCPYNEAMGFQTFKLGTLFEINDSITRILNVFQVL